MGDEEDNLTSHSYHILKIDGHFMVCECASLHAIVSYLVVTFSLCSLLSLFSLHCSIIQIPYLLIDTMVLYLSS